MDQEYAFLNVEEIEFDTDNPRIRMALEKYGDKLNAERIYFALRTATDNGDSVGSFSRLRDSIHANGGITQPITVVIKSGKKLCIDGNTRLAIYKDFLKSDGTSERWGKIRALVMPNATQRDIEKIRVSAHLVGARAWPAYEKARYLHYLYCDEFKGFEEMIDLCGGNRADIERQIHAYEDMNEFYRKNVDDNAFKIDRFSGFVELQKPQIRQAIFDAGFELSDFGKWISDGNIYRLADVRNLPKVLQDPEATEIFATGGLRSIERAIEHVDQKRGAKSEKNIHLEDAPLHTIAKTLAEKIREMPFSTLQALQKGEREEDVETVQIFEDLSERLIEILENVRK